MSSQDPPASSSVPDTYCTGRVKWFNNKAGYGFITKLTVQQDQNDESMDIFAHHTGICVDHEQYRYLVQGEYVTFHLVKTTEGEHEWQATDIKGIMRGKLMCETRLESKEIRDSKTVNRYEQGHSYNTNLRYRGNGPRDNAEWMLVKKKQSTKSEGQRHETVRARPPR